VACLQSSPDRHKRADAAMEIVDYDGFENAVREIALAAVTKAAAEDPSECVRYYAVRTVERLNKAWLRAKSRIR
jgi:hypothetical protein